MPSVRVLVQFLTIPIFFNLAVDTRASAHGGEDTRDDIPIRRRRSDYAFGAGTSTIRCSASPSTTEVFDMTEWNAPDTLLPMVFDDEVLLVDADTRLGCAPGESGREYTGGGRGWGCGGLNRCRFEPLAAPFAWPFVEAWPLTTPFTAPPTVLATRLSMPGFLTAAALISTCLTASSSRRSPFLFKDRLC